jgi:hypothetical protein
MYPGRDFLLHIHAFGWPKKEARGADPLSLKRENFGHTDLPPPITNPGSSDAIIQFPSVTSPASQSPSPLLSIPHPRLKDLEFLEASL